jgi:hypothetical protein
MEKLVPKGCVDLNAVLLEGPGYRSISLSGVGFYIPIPVDGGRIQGFSQGRNFLARVSLDNEQLPTSGTVTVLQFFQAAEHVGYPSGGNIVGVEQTRVQAKKANEFGAAIASRRQTHIVSQPQITTVPEHDQICHET